MCESCDQIGQKITEGLRQVKRTYPHPLGEQVTAEARDAAAFREPTFRENIQKRIAYHRQQIELLGLLSEAMPQALPMEVGRKISKMVHQI